MADEVRSEQLIDGPAGQIQLLVDEPAGPVRGVVLVAHPQPLLGGSPLHVVPVTLARRLVVEGWRVVRPSFRGVGKTTGPHDGGVGEADDCLALVEHLRSRYPELPLALVGFSFGAHVFARVACALPEQISAIALLGLPVGRVPGGRHYAALPLPPGCLLLHGEQDDMAPLNNLLDWARPDHRPVQIYPGTNHFFKSCLVQVAQQVADHLRNRIREGREG